MKTKHDKALEPNNYMLILLLFSALIINASLRWIAESGEEFLFAGILGVIFSGFALIVSIFIVTVKIREYSYRRQKSMLLGKAVCVLVPMTWLVFGFFVP